MVAAALRLGKAGWAEEFIQSNYHILPADSRDNTYTFNLARVHRYQKRYGEVLELLQNVEYADIRLQSDQQGGTAYHLLRTE
jgi:hypothetical protein